MSWWRALIYRWFIKDHLDRYGIAARSRYYPWYFTAPCRCRVYCERLKCGDEVVRVETCKRHDTSEVA